jgi:hypothetical protein
MQAAAAYGPPAQWVGPHHARRGLQPFYITVDNVDDTGTERPFEVLIDPKNLKHYPYEWR